MQSNKGTQSNKNKSGRSTGSSTWLQTLVVSGSLAATVVGVGMINRLETTQSATTDDETAIALDPLALEPIPTILVPPTAVAVVAILPTATPTAQSQTNQPLAVIPTDTPEPTVTPVPTIAPVIVQQSSAAQSSATTPVRRRSRSSR